MTSPLLVARGIHKIPAIAVTVGSSSTPAFSINSYNVTYAYLSGDPDGTAPITVGLEEAFTRLVTMMSPYNMVSSARRNFVGSAALTPKQYFNRIVVLLEAMLQTLKRLPGDIRDMNAIFDIANEIGLTNWKKGVTFEAVSDIKYKPVFNKLLWDVLRNNLAGPRDVTRNDFTLRWRTNTLWHAKYGVEEYFKVQGGSFLIFSTKTLPTDSADYTASYWKIPILFDQTSTTTAMNKMGESFALSAYDLPVADALTNRTLSRLFTLDSTVTGVVDPVLRIPSLDPSNGASNNPIQAASYMHQLMKEFFGIGRVNTSATTTPNWVYDVDAGTIAVIDVEISDISNAMLQYSRSFGPFVLERSSVDSIIGF
jgi:hypothetical protein